MLLILFIICVFMTYTNVYVKKKPLVSPRIIVWAVFGVTSYIAFLNNNEWGDISILTFCVILLELLVFSLGCGAAGVRNNVVAIGYERSSIYIPKMSTILIIAFLTVVTYIDYLEVARFSGGGAVGLLNIVAQARHNSYVDHTTIQHSFFVLQCLYFSKIIAYVYIFIFLHAWIMRKEVVLLNLIPVGIYFVQSILSTGRTEFIYLSYTFVFMFYMLSRGNHTYRKKFRLVFLSTVGGFIFIFMLLGAVRSGGDGDMLKSLSEYAGCSIIAFNNIIEKNGIESTSTFFL